MQNFIIDYSQVVNLATECIRIALPVGIIFGIGGRVTNFFIDMVTGKERVKL